MGNLLLLLLDLQSKGRFESDQVWESPCKSCERADQSDQARRFFADEQRKRRNDKREDSRPPSGACSQLASPAQTTLPFPNPTASTSLPQIPCLRYPAQVSVYAALDRKAALTSHLFRKAFFGKLRLRSTGHGTARTAMKCLRLMETGCQML